jgi:DNA-binding Lrp family transcriptional regulator
MSVQAYILVQTEVGKSDEVAQAINAISGVMNAEHVTGPYDVIVRAEAKSIDDLAKIVLTNIQKVSGITRTLTCPIVNL